MSSLYLLWKLFIVENIVNCVTIHYITTPITLLLIREITCFVPCQKRQYVAFYQILLTTEYIQFIYILYFFISTARKFHLVIWHEDCSLRKTSSSEITAITAYLATCFGRRKRARSPLIAIHDFSDFAEFPREAFRTSRNFRMWYIEDLRRILFPTEKTRCSHVFSTRAHERGIERKKEGDTETEKDRERDPIVGLWTFREEVDTKSRWKLSKSFRPPSSTLLPPPPLVVIQNPFPKSRTQPKLLPP